MFNRRLAIAVTIAVLTMALPESPGASQMPNRAEEAAQKPAITIPHSLEAEHHEIHEALLEATRLPGRVGAAAKELAAVLDPHFERENEIALPPLGLLFGSWREGRSGALRMGMKNGAWCVGCCWALMASFFALGIMSVVWMAIIAGLIAVEKLLPWRRVATYGTVAVLLALGVLLLAAPDAVPGLTIPGSQMNQMMNP